MTDTGRRAQQRFDIEIPVELTIEGRVLTTTTRNISLGGLFLNLTEPVPFGSTVGLKFELPDLDHPVEVEGHVRWVQPDVGLGVQFAGVRAKVVWALQRLIADHG
ncbi:MAG: PilZ domain-containing protein [bacterium]